MTHALTLALISHERLVKHARDLIREASRTIQEHRPRTMWPELVVIFMRLQPEGERILVQETSTTYRLDLDNPLQAQECAGSVVALCERDVLASAFYLIGGDARGKELQVVGRNVTDDTYALARPVKIREGVLTVSGKVRVLDTLGHAPPFLVQIVAEYKRLVKERTLWTEP